MSTQINTRLLPAALAALVLVGCASPDMDAAMREAAQVAAPVSNGARAQLDRTGEQRDEANRHAADLLAQPLTMDGAVQLALANSPAFQAALATGWSELSQARQRGLPGNPVFTFERMREGQGLELGRLLSIGLLDLLTLSQRGAVARVESEQARVRLAAAIVDQADAAKRAWVRAVAAREIEQYAEQVREAADASAELARRMQRAGNFSKLQAARQHLFYADATTRLAIARHATVSTREALVRTLGLSDAQARELKLPQRLPELPKAPLDASHVAKAAADQRIDVRLARLELDAAGKARGIDLLGSLVDIDLGARHDTNFDGAGGRATRNGFELDIRLPVFDWGATRRASLDARSLAAANRYEAASRAAASQTRESYSAYRTAFDLARHQRGELVPLRKTISEENLLRYNGMLIGVFELLADAREQVSGVIEAIEAQRDFWLADAALASTLVGKPNSEKRDS
jgi:outer membrane protein TolC